MQPFVLEFPEIDPVAFSIFGFDVHWYAITYLIGFLLAYLLMRRRLRHEPFRSLREPHSWSVDDIESILIHAIFGVLLGGRLGYVLFYHPEQYLQDPLSVITGIRTGGMSFHGGTIGVILALVIFAWRHKRPFLQVGDFLVPTIPLGLAAGRIGNFINGELWGRQASADLPWAMIFPTGGDVPRHPSQIYQALLEGLLLFTLLWLYARKPRYRGQVAAAFLIGYGFFRFIGEFWREPDSHLGFLAMGMSMGQWLSWPMVLAGVILWTWAGQQKTWDVVEGGTHRETTEGGEGADPTLSDGEGQATLPGDPEHGKAVENSVEERGGSSEFGGETTPASKDAAERPVTE